VHRWDGLSYLDVHTKFQKAWFSHLKVTRKDTGARTHRSFHSVLALFWQKQKWVYGITLLPVCLGPQCFVENEYPWSYWYLRVWVTSGSRNVCIPDHLAACLSGSLVVRGTYPWSYWYLCVWVPCASCNMRILNHLAACVFGSPVLPGTCVSSSTLLPVCLGPEWFVEHCVSPINYLTRLTVYYLWVVHVKSL
jgi:hypothetical protein